ncbi:MAG TPA: hypothetical protein VFZ66_08830 [Herpetosiphonaceae bacterium]
MTQSSLSPLPARPPRVGQVRYLVAFGAGLLLIVLSFVRSMVNGPAPETAPDDAIGFLLLLGGILALVAGVILALSSWYQTRRLARTLASKKLLASWIVSGNSWQRYIEDQRARATRETLQFILILVVIGSLVTLWDVFSSSSQTTSTAQAWIDFAAIMAVMSSFSAIGWAAAQIRLRLMKRQGSGAISITTDGVLLDRQWHSWRGLGRWLDGVTYESAPDHVLIFTYYRRGLRYNPTGEELRVPVPPRHAAEARQVVARFKQD